MELWVACFLLPLLVPLVDSQGKIGDLPDDIMFPDPTLPNSTFVPDGAMDGYCELILQGPVPVPPSQIPWNCICSHCQGNLGPKGERGDRGLQGRPGSPGPRGSQGPRGRPGFTGQQGIKGQKGDDGVKGAPGPQGLMGPKGSLGFKGEKGDHGLEGPPGDQGPKGDDGLCPEACEASEGPPGPPGVPGPAGIRGISGSDGLKGQKGAQGVRGAAGVPGSEGAPGAKGDQGPEGDCPCTDGEDGASGEKGDQGEQGPAGEQGAKGDQGIAGEKGEEGLMGMMGPPGPCMPMIQSSFSAALTTPFPPSRQPVPFSKIYSNVQEDYIPSMGIYVAPTNGTYVFSFHLSVSEGVLVVGLFKNFRTELVFSGTTALSTVSQTVILHLAEGDGVWLQVRDSDSNHMFTSPESSSIFSGFLLHPDRCEGQMPDMGGFPIMGREGEGLGALPPGFPTPTPKPPKYDWLNSIYDWPTPSL